MTYVTDAEGPGAVVWGEPIEAKTVGYPEQNVAPAWIVKGEPMRYAPSFPLGEWFDMPWNGYGFSLVGCAFRLPADHWAYTPIAAGYTPIAAGGESAPDDWDDTRPVISTTGYEGAASRTAPGWDGRASPRIIGYHRKPTARAVSPEMVFDRETLDRARAIVQKVADLRGVPYPPLGSVREALTVIDDLTGPPPPPTQRGNPGSTLDIVNKVVTKLNDGPAVYPYFHNVGDAMNAIDGLIAKRADEHKSDNSAQPLHMPTVRAVLDESFAYLDKAPVPTAKGSYEHLRERFMPPDPLTERAKQLHAAARSAHDTTQHGEGGFALTDWDKLSDALRKFWIAMARIDGERDQ
jgi:hypothetical protein